MRKPVSKEPLVFQLSLDRTAAASPLKEQIYSELLRFIDEDILKPGDRLPSTRALAAQLGISRITVVAAFDRLCAEGYLQSAIGRGTVVAKATSREAEKWHGYFEDLPRDKPLTERAKQAQAASEFRVQEQRPFAIVSPDFESLPGKKWEQLVARVSKSPWRHNGYCQPGGYEPFREAIAEYARRTRGVKCTGAEVIVTSGIQQALTMCAQLLFSEGDAVIIEDPGYKPHRQALEFQRVATVPIPVDDEGLQVPRELDPETQARVKGILVTPCHQYPLGRLMSADRREELFDWARSRGLWLIEDDYDGELRYGGAPFPALASLDQHRDSVIYMGSFTKLIYPGFNLGYVIVPRMLARAFEGAKLLNDRHASEVHQVILSEFINAGFYDAHARRLKRLYERRRQTMIDCAVRFLSGFGAMIDDGQGTQLTFIFSVTIKDTEFSLFLRQQYGIEVRPLSACYVKVQPLQGMILGFAGFTEAQIVEGMTKIERALKTFLKTVPSVGK